MHLKCHFSEKCEVRATKIIYCDFDGRPRRVVLLLRPIFLLVELFFKAAELLRTFWLDGLSPDLSVFNSSRINFNFSAAILIFFDKRLIICELTFVITLS